MSDDPGLFDKMQACKQELQTAIEKSVCDLEPAIAARYSVHGTPLSTVIGDSLISVGMRYYAKGRLATEEEWHQIGQHLRLMMLGLSEYRRQEQGGKFSSETVPASDDEIEVAAKELHPNALSIQLQQKTDFHGTAAKEVGPGWEVLAFEHRNTFNYEADSRDELLAKLITANEKKK
jgi:hypothetical protein